MRSKSTAVGGADAAWGHDMPDWVRALRDECIFTSQNKVARRLGYAAAVVSQVLRNKYKGSLSNVQAQVRAVLMREVVGCPQLGEIQRTTCAQWAAKTSDFLPSNPLRVRMFRACSSCIHNRNTNTGDSDDRHPTIKAA